MIILLTISISSTYFGWRFCPSSGVGDLVTSRQHRRCFIPQAVNTV